MTTDLTARHGLCLCPEPHDWAPTTCTPAQDDHAALRALLGRLQGAKEDPCGGWQYGDGTTAEVEIQQPHISQSDLDVFVDLVTAALNDDRRPTPA